MKALTFHIALLLFTSSALSQDMELLVNLRGEWLFEIGDDTARAAFAYDDSGWDHIDAPAFWEDQGYPGYDGWAWYRKHFRIAGKHRFEALYLHIGNIDDVDEVYINGQFVAFQGSPPPHYMTGFAEHRWYYVPYEYLRFDAENVIAVRVYDHELGGGIVRGNLGMYRYTDYLVPDQSLRGTWKLRLGDQHAWRLASHDDSDWGTAFVPIYWETQTERDYDGFGWYRREFTLDPALRGERLVLLLGKIDDVDEVWLNGKRIGGTGRMPGSGRNYIGTDTYAQLRAYYVPSDALRKDGVNVLAVRVYDGFLHGGIYEGPVGLVRQQRYRDWESTTARKEKTGLERLLESLFGD